MKGITNATEEFNENLNNLEQLVNYTMLYDKDLGEKELNKCKEITGNWSGCAAMATGTGNYSQSAPTVTPYDTYLNVTHSASNTLGCLLTEKLIDITEYSKYLVNGYFYSSGNQYPWQRLTIKTGRSGEVDSIINGPLVKNATYTGWRDVDLTNKTGSGYIGIEYYYYNITTTTNIYYALLVKSDNIQGLIERANITATTIDEILTNSETLLNNESAVNYMIKQCTGDFMAAAIQNSTFLTALSNSPYASLIYANEHWAKFLGMVS